MSSFSFKLPGDCESSGDSRYPDRYDLESVFDELFPRWEREWEATPVRRVDGKMRDFCEPRCMNVAQPPPLASFPSTSSSNSTSTSLICKDVSRLAIEQYGFRPPVLPHVVSSNPHTLMCLSNLLGRFQERSVALTTVFYRKLVLLFPRGFTRQVDEALQLSFESRRGEDYKKIYKLLLNSSHGSSLRAALTSTQIIRLNCSELFYFGVLLSTDENPESLKDIRQQQVDMCIECNNDRGLFQCLRQFRGEISVSAVSHNTSVNVFTVLAENAIMNHEQAYETFSSCRLSLIKSPPEWSLVRPVDPDDQILKLKILSSLLQGMGPPPSGAQSDIESDLDEDDDPRSLKAIQYFLLDYCYLQAKGHPHIINYLFDTLLPEINPSSGTVFDKTLLFYSVAAAPLWVVEKLVREKGLTFSEDECRGVLPALLYEPKTERYFLSWKYSWWFSHPQRLHACLPNLVFMGVLPLSDDLNGAMKLLQTILLDSRTTIVHLNFILEHFKSAFQKGFSSTSPLELSTDWLAQRLTKKRPEFSTQELSFTVQTDYDEERKEKKKEKSYFSSFDGEKDGEEKEKRCFIELSLLSKLSDYGFSFGLDVVSTLEALTSRGNIAVSSSASLRILQIAKVLLNASSSSAILFDNFLSGDSVELLELYCQKFPTEVLFTKDLLLSDEKIVSLEIAEFIWIRVQKLPTRDMRCYPHEWYKVVENVSHNQILRCLRKIDAKVKQDLSKWSTDQVKELRKSLRLRRHSGFDIPERTWTLISPLSKNILSAKYDDQAASFIINVINNLPQKQAADLVAEMLNTFCKQVFPHSGADFVVHRIALLLCLTARRSPVSLVISNYIYEETRQQVVLGNSRLVGLEFAPCYSIRKSFDSKDRVLSSEILSANSTSLVAEMSSCFPLTRLVPLSADLPKRLSLMSFLVETGEEELFFEFSRMFENVQDRENERLEKIDTEAKQRHRVKKRGEYGDVYYEDSDAELKKIRLEKMGKDYFSTQKALLYAKYALHDLDQSNSLLLTPLIRAIRRRSMRIVDLLVQRFPENLIDYRLSTARWVQTAIDSDDSLCLAFLHYNNKQLEELNLLGTHQFESGVSIHRSSFNDKNDSYNNTYAAEVFRDQIMQFSTLRMIYYEDDEEREVQSDLGIEGATATPLVSESDENVEEEEEEEDNELDEEVEEKTSNEEEGEERVESGDKDLQLAPGSAIIPIEEKQKVSALFYAAKFGKKAAVETLLRLGANVDRRELAPQ